VKAQTGVEDYQKNENIRLKVASLSVSGSRDVTGKYEEEN
jgi:hypothetical protein